MPSSSSSSPPSSPGLERPFQPLYAVMVTEPVKNGDVVRYTVKTSKLSDDAEFTVTRQYEDFEYLHHCLQIENFNDGIIVSIIRLSAVCRLFLPCSALPAGNMQGRCQPWAWGQAPRKMSLSPPTVKQTG